MANAWSGQSKREASVPVVSDRVVAGFRWHKDGGIVGSLQLGLFDDGGVLHHVGVAFEFTKARRAELVDELEPYRSDARPAAGRAASAAGMRART